MRMKEKRNPSGKAGWTTRWQRRLGLASSARLASNRSPEETGAEGAGASALGAPPRGGEARGLSPPEQGRGGRVLVSEGESPNEPAHMLARAEPFRGGAPNADAPAPGEALVKALNERYRRMVETEGRRKETVVLARYPLDDEAFQRLCLMKAMRMWDIQRLSRDERLRDLVELGLQSARHKGIIKYLRRVGAWKKTLHTWRGNKIRERYKVYARAIDAVLRGEVIAPVPPYWSYPPGSAGVVMAVYDLASGTDPRVVSMLLHRVDPLHRYVRRLISQATRQTPPEPRRIYPLIGTEPDEWLDTGGVAMQMGDIWLRARTRKGRRYLYVSLAR